MYCTQEDLTTRFGDKNIKQLTDRQFLNDSDVDVITVSVNDATSLIDSYISKLYTVPLVEIPPVINYCCCDIAYYYLHGSNVSANTRQRYEDALRVLSDIAMGKMVLPVATTPQFSGRTQFTSYPTVWGRSANGGL